jgi:hypothetical protein
MSGPVAEAPALFDRCRMPTKPRQPRIHLYAYEFEEAQTGCQRRKIGRRWTARRHGGRATSLPSGMAAPADPPAQGHLDRACPKIRTTMLPFSSCEGGRRFLCMTHRSSDAASPSLGVSSLDLGCAHARPFFLSGPETAGPSRAQPVAHGRLRRSLSARTSPARKAKCCPRPVPRAARAPGSPGESSPPPPRPAAHRPTPRPDAPRARARPGRC